MERFGRYELASVLGKGGEGIVYDAVLCGPGGLRMPVALKMLHEGSDAIRREARIGGLLRHANLVDVYEIGEVDGRWFCAMERCTGSLANRAPLPPRAVVEVGLQVCAALQYAHEELQLVHLDLKPANLLLAEDGTVKVADLGIARAEGFSHQGGFGTPGYMSPERARGLPVDARADVFGLGVTLLELAGFRVPRGDTTQSWLDTDRVTRTTRPLPPEDGTPPAPLSMSGVPAWLADVVDRCVQRAPEDRWPTMEALAAALRDVDVAGPGLRQALGIATALPTEPRRSMRTNLGRDTNRFVGRVAALAELGDHLSRPGLTTLKGTAGVGKTRLAAMAMREWLTVHPGQAWWADLTDVHSAEGLLYAVALALGLRLHDDEGERLGQAMAARGRMLLVLDNFEQVQHLARMAADWCRAAPEATFVVTSRVALGIEGETVVEVPPLPPADAVALIMARARERGAEVDDDEALRSLAERLDGLPLALELAAGRLGVLSVHDLLERLTLSLLRDGTSDRHATLRAALDCSWALLSDPARAALAQLSVFSGGFTMAAAEGVVALPKGSVLDAVGQLVDASMVIVDGDRFDMLLGVRAFAASHLPDPSGPEGRHGAFFARFGSREVQRSMRSHGGLRRQRALALELDNLIVACERAAARGDGWVAVRALQAAWTTLAIQGPYAKAYELAGYVRALPGLDSSDEAAVVQIQGWVLRNRGRASDAGDLFEAAAARFLALGAPEDSAVALHDLGGVRMMQGRMAQARASFDKALELCLEARDRRLEAVIRNSLGSMCIHQGELEQARAYLSASLALAEEIGDRTQIGVTLGNLGSLPPEHGGSMKSPMYYEMALDIALERGDQHAEALLRSNLAGHFVDCGRLEEAAPHFEAALGLFRTVGDRRRQGFAWTNLGILDSVGGDTEGAITRLGVALDIHRQTGDRVWEGYTLCNLGKALHHHGDLDGARTVLEDALRIAREVDDRQVEGTTLGTLGILEHDAGHPRLAGEHLRSGVHRLHGAGMDMVEGVLLGYLARTEAHLGHAAEATRHLSSGLALLEHANAAPSLAEFLAVRAGVQWRAGEHDGARATLARAEAMAPPGMADAKRAIERTRALLGA